MPRRPATTSVVGKPEVLDCLDTRSCGGLETALGARVELWKLAPVELSPMAIREAQAHSGVINPLVVFCLACGQTWSKA